MFKKLPQKEAFESVDFETPIKDKITVSFNANFMVVILNILKGPNVTLQWDDVHRPMKIMSSNDRGLDVFYLLVPARF